MLDNLDKEIVTIIKSLLKSTFQGNVHSFSGLTPQEQHIVGTPENFRKICDFAGVHLTSAYESLSDGELLNALRLKLQDESSTDEVIDVINKRGLCGAGLRVVAAHVNSQTKKSNSERRDLGSELMQCPRCQTELNPYTGSCMCLK